MAPWPLPPTLRNWNQVYHAFDKGEFVSCLFIDLAEALALVNMSYLLRNLFLYWIWYIGNYWIRSYLTGRVKFTNIDDSCSSVLSIERGGNQGRVLVPFLFLIFIYDLCKSSEFLNFYFYADESRLLCSSKNIYELIGKLNFELVKINIYIWEQN